jgi:hypothetical protein
MRINYLFFYCLLFFISITIPYAQNCSDPHTLCVDDQAGANQEYSTIQAAANVAKPGDTVFVFNGNYTGFQIENSGSTSARITYKAQSDQVIITAPSSSGDGIRLNNVSDVTLDGFQIVSSEDKDIAARGATPTNPMVRLIIRNNICRNSAHESIYLSEVANSLIEYNVITGNTTNVYYRNHGIYLANAGSDNTILRGNIISQNLGEEGNGIHINGDLSVGGDGVITGLVIENNIIWNNGQNGLNMDGVQSSTIQNNLIFSNARHAVRAYKEDGAEGPKKLIFINNTLIAPATSDGWPFKLTGDGGGNVIFNNILLSEGESKGGFVVGNPNFSSNYNIVSGNFSLDEENTILNLTKWRAQGHDSASVVATPAELFENPSKNDFHLKKSAEKAIGKGVESLNSINAPGTDIEMKLRLKSTAQDIGAYSYSGQTGLVSGTIHPTGDQLFSLISINSCISIRSGIIQDQSIKITILDISGRIIACLKTNPLQKRFDISNLSAGIYILKVEMGKRFSSKQMIVNR